MSEEKQERPPIVSIKMVPAGVELVIAALRKLPHEQVDGLVQEIAGQYGYQMQQLQAAAEKAKADAVKGQEQKNLVKQVAAPAAPAKKATKKAVKK